MNTSALLWLSVLLSGLASTLGAYLFLSAGVRRIDWQRARRMVWIPNLARTGTRSYSWVSFAAPALGLVFALKATWNGGWVVAFALIFTGLFFLEPLRILIRAGQISENTEVADLALLCMAQERRDANVLQILDEASVMLNHSGVRRIVKEVLQFFYSGATEGEALEHLLTQHPNSDWALLLWALLERGRASNSGNLRTKLDALMRHRVRLHKYTLPALEMTRRSLGLTLILCAALATFVTLAPASSFYLSSLQGQALGSALLFLVVWIASIWSAQLQTLERMSE